MAINLLHQVIDGETQQWNLYLDQVIQSLTAQIRFLKPTKLLNRWSEFRNVAASTWLSWPPTELSKPSRQYSLDQLKSTTKPWAGQDLLHCGFLRGETHRWTQPLRKRWYEWTWQSFILQTPRERYKTNKKNNFHLSSNNPTKTGSSWNIYIK